MELKETGWPLIELGYGLVEVAEGTQGEKPALIFGRNGTGEIGEPTQPDRVATHDETLAVVTFANVASLDVVVGKLQQLRAKMLPDNAEVSGLSAEEVYGVIASVEAEVRLSMFAAMKQAQQKGTL